MTFVQSSIMFGTYTFPAAFAIKQRQQDSVIEEAKIPFGLGTVAPAGTLGAKLIQVTGIIGGSGAVDSSGSLITTLDQCENEANLMAVSLENGYAALSIGTSPVRYLTAQKRRFMVTPLEGAGRCAVQVDIEFYAQDPRWISSAATTQNFSTGGTANLTSNGAAITYPKATFHGPGANPGLQITPAGASGYVLVRPTITLASSDTLVIDCDPRNRQNAILLNGAPRLDLLGTSGSTNTLNDGRFFPYLLGGVNSTNAGFTGGTGTGTSVSVSWNDAYIF